MELYNLKDDPKETPDLKNAEPMRFAAMKKALQELNTAVEKESPDWWKRLSPNEAREVKK